jgi:omega-amidase
MKSIRVGLSYDLSWLRQGRRPPELRRMDLLLFPELVNGGYAALAAGGGVHTPGDSTLQLFRDLTRHSAMRCVAGTVCLENRDGRRTNSSLVFSGGSVIHRYDKIHLFHPAGDHRYFSPGSTFGTFRVVRGLQTGVIVCYDLRFPEIIRSMALQGMRLLLVPARWPAVRDRIWRTLLRARAIENQIFVIGCNARGEEGGASYAFDPLGDEIFSSRQARRRDVTVLTLSPGTLAVARRHHNNLEEARVLKSSRIPRSLFPRR